MSTFPQTFKLSDLMVPGGWIEADPLTNALNSINEAGNWPSGMEPIEKVKLSVLTALVTIRTVLNEHERETSKFDMNALDVMLCDPGADKGMEAINALRIHNGLSRTYLRLDFPQKK